MWKYDAIAVPPRQRSDLLKLTDMHDFLRPSRRHVISGNVSAFLSVGLGLWAGLVYPAGYGGPFTWMCFGILAFCSLTIGVAALKAFCVDWRRRSAWAEAQRPATDKHDGRWATYQEMVDAGMYDGVGRLLGMDMEERLLFEPHRLKPIFSYFLGGQGSGKTSTQVIASAVLSPLSPKPRAAQKK